MLGLIRILLSGTMCFQISEPFPSSFVLRIWNLPRKAKTEKKLKTTTPSFWSVFSHVKVDFRVIFIFHFDFCLIGPSQSHVWIRQIRRSGAQTFKKGKKVFLQSIRFLCWLLVRTRCPDKFWIVSKESQNRRKDRPSLFTFKFSSDLTSIWRTFFLTKK